MVAAGALVTRDVPAHGLVVGVPARLTAYVCRCGERLIVRGANGDRVWLCERDGLRYRMSDNGDLVE
jgi:hypothetical protein